MHSNPDTTKNSVWNDLKSQMIRNVRNLGCYRNANDLNSSGTDLTQVRMIAKIISSSNESARTAVKSGLRPKYGSKISRWFWREAHGGEIFSINFEPPDIDLCSACHVYPIFQGASIISILFIVNRFTWGLN